MSTLHIPHRVPFGSETICILPPESCVSTLFSLVWRDVLVLVKKGRFICRLAKSRDCCRLPRGKDSPDDQYYDGAHDGSYETGAFTGLVPAERLAKISGDERSRDA